MAKEKIIQGITGEYYAAGKLSSLKLTVAMTLKNAPNYDLLVTDGKRAKMIQVKTTEGPKAIWTFSKVAEPNTNLVFVLVILKPAKNCNSPAFYIVPSKAVNAQQIDRNKIYIKNQIKRGVKPDPTKKGVYKFIDLEGKYRDKWKHLGLQLKM